MTINQITSQNCSVQQEYRALVQKQRQKMKQRQQAMLTRLSAEIGN
ncbi:MAG: hypothetical protein F6K30_10600 [Cyanothece sp. SIO2G6]|nr:hypothetical protein [Cyanothece sp. SIO2G6]